MMLAEIQRRLGVDAATAMRVQSALASASASVERPFTENETKDVLTALYQDGHVDLVLADRVAALMASARPTSVAPPQEGICPTCGGDVWTAEELADIKQRGRERARRMGVPDIPPPAGDAVPPVPEQEPAPGEGYEHWRDMAADTVNHFWFTNREAGVLLAEVDRLRGVVQTLRAPSFPPRTET